MKFKVGDKVRVKTFHELLEIYGDIDNLLEKTCYVADMEDYGNEIVTITEITDKEHYHISGNEYYWREEMLNIYKTRGFEVVSEPNRRTTTEIIELPTRADDRSAGYDFYAPIDYKCEPHKVTKIWTDVKSYMLADEVLLIDVRSSMGGKFHLANTIGVVDSSYYENEDNDGNIGIFLVNDTDEVIEIKSGDRIAQGIFIKYLTVDNDEPLSHKRCGGFGSSGK